MVKNLIYDVGFHLGEDSAFYLHKGYKVIGVDGSPSSVAHAGVKFKQVIDEGRLIMVNKAVTETGEGAVDFYLSEKADWNSTRSEIAGRENQKYEKVVVETTTLRALFDVYGVPYYCKIDIEGNDLQALRSLSGDRDLPAYISCETECSGDNEVVSEEEALETLEVLRELGYNRFKLVDQYDLGVLSKKPYYKVDVDQPGVLFRVSRKMLQMVGYNLRHSSILEKLSQRHGFKFEQGCSGPFGEELEGKWISYAEARDVLLFQRESFFRIAWPFKTYNMWCDWHAAF